MNWLGRGKMARHPRHPTGDGGGRGELEQEETDAEVGMIFSGPSALQLQKRRQPGCFGLFGSVSDAGWAELLVGRVASRVSASARVVPSSHRLMNSGAFLGAIFKAGGAQEVAGESAGQNGISATAPVLHLAVAAVASSPDGKAAPLSSRRVLLTGRCGPESGRQAH
jgi:hypothetical protein